jgi:hypothetical protein
MLAGLIDDGCGQQFRRLEVAHREPFEPRLLAAAEALQLSASNVPQLNIDAVRPALAEEENGHGGSLASGEEKANHHPAMLKPLRGWAYGRFSWGTP